MSRHCPGGFASSADPFPPAPSPPKIAPQRRLRTRQPPVRGRIAPVLRRHHQPALAWHTARGALNFFSGSVAQLRVYDYTRSPEEISATAAAKLAVTVKQPAPPLLK